MGKTYWYVDSENVHYNLDALVRAVKRYDRVVYAYSVANPCIAVKYLEEFAKKRVKVLYLNCQVGSPNAMDFQIVMQMAADYMSGVAEAVRVYSNDHGFIIPIKAWADKGHNFGVLHTDDFGSIKTAVKKPASESDEPKSTAQIIPVLTSDAAKTLLADIATCVGEAESNNVYTALRLSGGNNIRFNAELQVIYKNQSQHAGKLYHAAKHFLPRWREAKIEHTESVSEDTGLTLIQEITSCAGKDKAATVCTLLKGAKGSIQMYNALLMKHYKPKPGDKSVAVLYKNTKKFVPRWKEL